MDTVNKVRHAIGINSGDNQFTSPDVVSNRQGSVLERLNAIQAFLGESAGRDWFLDAADGDNDNSGQNWDAPKLTMAAVFALLSSGDRVFFKGKVTEQLTTPKNVFDVTVIGVGNRPRHIDGTPKAGSESTAMWTIPAIAASTPLCIVQQQGWKFVNFLVAGPTDAACFQLLRDAGAGDLEKDGSHAEFWNIRGASGQDFIEQSGGCGHVGIYGCFVTSMTGYVIKSTVGAGVGYPIRWELIGNRFLDNTNMLKMVCTGWRIEGNSFISTTTEILDTDAGDATAGKNVVVNNYFNVAAADFDPDGNVEGNSTDVWSNFLLDVIETGVPAN